MSHVAVDNQNCMALLQPRALSVKGRTRIVRMVGFRNRNTLRSYGPNWAQGKKKDNGRNKNTGNENKGETVALKRREERCRVKWV